MKTIKKIAGVTFVASLSLGLVASVAIAPQTSRADGNVTKSCINAQGMNTQILDESTILASNGSANTVIKVSGCRLDSSKVLVFEYRGTSQICDRLDLDLKLMTSTGNGLGFPEACFISEVKSISKEEAKALKASVK